MPKAPHTMTKLPHVSTLLALSACLQNGVDSFTGRIERLRPAKPSFDRPCRFRKRPFFVTTDDSDSSNNDDDNSSSIDEFLRDFRDAKASKMGGQIPEEQLKESAAQAESDFLQAMKETKDEFRKAKKELGSEGAVDMFLDRIRKEDEAREDSGGSGSKAKNENEEDGLLSEFQ